MPIYVYRCPACSTEVEEIRSITDTSPAPRHCGREMNRAPTTASFAFRTAGGNLAGFSPSHGPVTKGNRKPKTITNSMLGRGKRPKRMLRQRPDGKVEVLG
jgi:putative FmdB family regulatory protein